MGGRADRTSRPTMEDVAARAGVSRALVSIVFRNVPGASDATRARVLAAAAALDYRPDRRARLLGRSRTRLVGVVFGVQHAFHGDLVEELYAATDASGYDVALSAVTPSRDERRAVHALLDDRCEAIVLLGPQLPRRELSALAARLPTLVLARKVRADGVDVVRTDDADGIRQAVDHLAVLGHERIAHIDGGSSPGAAERRSGYRVAMRRAGLAEHTTVARGGQSEDDGADAARRLMESSTPPTAVAVFNDRSAIGVLDTLWRQGMDVPADISVVGFDDSRLARLSHIDLTTVGQDARRMARLAVDRVVARLEAEPVDGAEQVVPPRLVVRGTTAPPCTPTPAAAGSPARRRSRDHGSRLGDR